MDQIGIEGSDKPRENKKKPIGIKLESRSQINPGATKKKHNYSNLEKGPQINPGKTKRKPL